MKILLAIDYSAGSVEALESLYSVCDPGPASVHVLNVTNNTSHSSRQLAVDQANQFIASSVAKLSARFPHCQFTGEQALGPPSKLILETASKIGSELIVMGNHENGKSSLLMDSVPHQVLTHAKCGVRIVRAAMNAEPKDSYNVLVATNDTEESDYALDRILSTSWPRNSMFKFVTVTAKHGAAEVDAQYERFANSWLKSCVVRLNEKITPQMVSAEILSGAPSKTILDEAKTWPADLIILGARRHSLAKVFSGSVSEAVASHALCSVEVLALPEKVVQFVSH